MRDFHELVLDAELNPAVFNVPGWPWGLLTGSVDTLKIVVLLDAVEGGDTTFSLGLFDNSEPSYNHVNFLAWPLDDVALTAGQQTVLKATYTPAEGPASHVVYLLATLGGSAPKAHVRIWVTGRRN